MDDPERASIDEDADNEFPPPRRPVRPAVIVGIMALVVLVIAGGIFAATRFAGGGANALPTPTLVPGSNLFYVQTSPACEAAFYLVTQSGYTTYSNINLPGNPNATINWSTGNGANLAAGCLLTATAFPPQANPDTPVPTTPPFAHCLYRFGVLLALDSEAHTLWPNLPLADAYEQNIAQQIKV